MNHGLLRGLACGTSLDLEYAVRMYLIVKKDVNAYLAELFTRQKRHVGNE
jgi:hypothetical protein